MRILSTKLPVVDSLTEKELFEVIIKWLKYSGAYKEIGAELERTDKKTRAHIEKGEFTIDTLVTKKEKSLLYLFKLEQNGKSGCRKIEIILKINGKKEVIFHIDCSGKDVKAEAVLDKEADVIRKFIASGFVNQPPVPITRSPIEATVEISDWLSTAVVGEYSGEMPIVFLSQFFDNMAYAADHEALAKRLAGIAYVITCDSEITRVIQEKAGKRTDFNGSAVIYSASSKSVSMRPRDVYGAGVDEEIVARVLGIVNSKMDSEGISWDLIQSEMLKADADTKTSLLSDAKDKKESLEEQLKGLRAKCESLTEENRKLRVQNEALSFSLQESSGADSVIKAPICELYNGEIQDLTVNIMKKALSFYEKGSRPYEIVEAFLAVNKEKGEGREIFETVKSIFSAGHALTKKDLNELQRMGFSYTDDGKHYKLRFKNSEKYWFTVPKSPSDDRYGKNLTSSITKRLSVYR